MQYLQNRSEYQESRIWRHVYILVVECSGNNQAIQATVQQKPQNRLPDLPQRLQPPSDLSRSTLRAKYMIWDIKPCSPLKDTRRFGETYRFHLQGRKIGQVRNQHEEGGKQKPFLLVSRWAFSSSLKLQATYSFRTSLDLQRTTWHYNPRTQNSSPATNVRTTNPDNSCFV
jgi:hypothetical protein